MPVKVFNLSITRPDIIDATHERMRSAFHPDGGPWQRAHMPRTVMVFLNEQPGLSAEQRRAAAKEEAAAALNMLTPEEFDEKVRPENMIGPKG